jgi:predicted sulfurtransferase
MKVVKTFTDSSYSYSNDKPFHRFKVTIKNEIVTMGNDDIKP